MLQKEGLNTPFVTSHALWCTLMDYWSRVQILSPPCLEHHDPHLHQRWKLHCKRPYTTARGGCSLFCSQQMKHGPLWGRQDTWAPLCRPHLDILGIQNPALEGGARPPPNKSKAPATNAAFTILHSTDNMTLFTNMIFTEVEQNTLYNLFHFFTLFFFLTIYRKNIIEWQEGKGCKWNNIMPSNTVQTACKNSFKWNLAGVNLFLMW